MRRIDPVLAALVFAVLLAIASVAYVVHGVLTDGPRPAPVPYSTDRGQALENADTVHRGLGR
jgi:hypothetical protein